MAALSNPAIDASFIRTVRIDRTRTAEAALKAACRNYAVDRGVVDTMPRGRRDEVSVHFFNIGRYVSDAELDKEYELRGLVPADPYALAAVNEAEPAFALEQPNAIHWKNADGRWCCATFRRLFGERHMYVDFCGGHISLNGSLTVTIGSDDWSGRWWFAGV